MNEQLLLNKWQILEADEQAQVLAFIDAICQHKQQEQSSQTKRSKTNAIRKLF